MKKTVRKLFWAWQFEDEEKWLNQMAQDGWALCDVGFCRYTFEQCEMGEYTFKLELLANHTGHSESVKYIGFITDTGAEYIGNVLRWVYFRQKTASGSILFHANSLLAVSRKLEKKNLSNRRWNHDTV